MLVENCTEVDARAIDLKPSFCSLAGGDPQLEDHCVSNNSLGRQQLVFRVRAEVDVLRRSFESFITSQCCTMWQRCALIKNQPRQTLNFLSSVSVVYVVSEKDRTACERLLLDSNSMK